MITKDDDRTILKEYNSVNKWIEVDHAYPCPICGSWERCHWSQDLSTFVICGGYGKRLQTTHCLYNTTPYKFETSDGVICLLYRLKTLEEAGAEITDVVLLDRFYRKTPKEPYTRGNVPNPSPPGKPIPPRGGTGQGKPIQGLDKVYLAEALDILRKLVEVDPIGTNPNGPDKDNAYCFWCRLPRTGQKIHGYACIQHEETCALTLAHALLKRMGIES